MENTLSKALRVLGDEEKTFNQLLVNMTGSSREKWTAELRKFVRGEPCWNNGNGTQMPEPKATTSILEFVSTIVVSATTGKFVAKEKFVITEPNARVKIGYLSDKFVVWFLNGNSKAEDLISEQTLRYYKLLESSTNDLIIAEIGGKARAKTTLSEMFALMEKQGKGEDGVLLKNGNVNIFYIKGKADVLRAVIVSWLDGAWHVDADSVEDPRRWFKSNQVFSR